MNTRMRHRGSALDEDLEAAAGDQHRLTQCLLGHRSEHQGDDERRGGESVSAHEEPEDTAGQHDLHVDEALVDGEGAEDTQHDDDRAENPERHTRDAGEGRMQKMLTATTSRCRGTCWRSGPRRTPGSAPSTAVPGCRPHIRNPPSRTAVAPPPGMPRVSSGIIAPDDAALFAASGPTSPGIAPLPNFHGVREIHFSTL